MAKPGRMDTKITVEERSADSPPQNSYGEPSWSWATFATRWAEKIDKSGREFFQGGVVGEISCVFKVRYIDGVTQKMRIKCGSDYYDIVDIAEYGRQDTQELMAKIQDNG